MVEHLHFIDMLEKKSTLDSKPGSHPGNDEELLTNTSIY